MKHCYCNSHKSFEICCEPYLNKQTFPQTPEQLMRSRYSAYVLQNADYLMETTHVSERKHYSKSEILEWAKSNTWMKLEVIKAFDDIVEFKAYYLDSTLKAKIHHEKSSFKQENGVWFYVDGEFY